MKDISIVEENEIDETVLTAILISLFTNKDEPDPRFDALNSYWANPALGSRLSRLERTKIYDGILSDTKKWVLESLKWLVDEGWLKPEILVYFSENKLMLRVEDIGVNIDLKNNTYSFRN